MRYKNKSKAYQSQYKKAEGELKKAKAEVKRLEAEQGQVERLKIWLLHSRRQRGLLKWREN